MQVSSFPDVEQHESKKRKNGLILEEEVKQAVLTGLGHFAPRSTVEILTGFLEQEYEVDFSTIADDPKTLREGLTKMFGSAESVVDVRIVQALAKQLQLNSDGRSLEELLEFCKNTP